MGGSSLAPEVITRTLGVRLTVLDTTDPHQVRAALADRLERTVVVVSSKSGSTVETDSHRRAYWQAFADAGIDDIGRRFVIVTDPGSPLEQTARDMGAHLVLADPDVGGRYSALTAFGLVPAALAGVKVAELLDQAEEFSASIGRDDARRRATRRWPWARPSERPHWPGGTRSPWSTTAPASPGWATGPSSSSPSPPARTARASCRWWWRTRPRPARPATTC